MQLSRQKHSQVSTVFSESFYNSIQRRSGTSIIVLRFQKQFGFKLNPWVILQARSLSFPSTIKTLTESHRSQRRDEIFGSDYFYEINIMMAQN